MCGIAGIWGYHEGHGGGDALRDSIERMTEHMRDRGPDAYGFWKATDAPLCLGHRRLSIMDLSENGSQPMVSHDGRYVMVYNGEIYDSGALRERLIEEGHVTAFRGGSDSEVLLEAIAAYGIAQALRLCRGMFAIGVYDTQAGILRLARDRVGEKPLYYGFTADRRIFAFASDIGCFPEIAGFDNELRREVLPLYFIHGYIPAPYTIYRDIWKLEPGTILTLRLPIEYFDPYSELDRLEREACDAAISAAGGAASDAEPHLTSGTGHIYTRYWSMREEALRGMLQPFSGSREEAADELERLLSSSIRGQMVADVPLGAFLSAGIDSSTIVSLMQAQAPGRVRTFTIGMETEGYNEADDAAMIARHLGCDHTTLTISQRDAQAVIPGLADMFGEPFADSSQIPTYLVSRMTREHVTVSLSGDGGDELFCGYTSYNSIDRIWKKLRRVPYILRRPASALLSPLVSGETMQAKAALLGARGPIDLHRIEQQTDPLCTRLVAGIRHDALPYKLTQLPEHFLGEHDKEVMLADLLLYHPDDILVKVDRCAMAVSLETRVPMLDKDVIAFAWSLPVSYLRSDGSTPGDGPVGTGKLVLRDPQGHDGQAQEGLLHTHRPVAAHARAL